jgi:hypothetical protein
MMRIPLLPLVLLPLAAVASEPGEVDVADELRRNVDLRIESATRLKQEPSREDRQALERALGKDANLAQGVLVYDLTLEGEPTDDVPTRVALLALDAPLEGGTLAVTVDERGAVVGRKVWGAQPFDDDPKGWDLYLGQFDRQASLNRASDPTAAVPAKKLDQALEQLMKEEGDQAASVRALYQQRLIMRANSYRFSTKRSGMSGAGGVEWVRRWREDYLQLLERSGDIERLLNEDVRDEYRAAAEAGESILAGALKSLQAGDARAAAFGLKDLYSSSCERCHQIEGHGLGEKNLYFSTMEGLPELSVRGDFARVGTDVFALPDREESCQAVASGLKACLLILGTVR